MEVDRHFRQMAARLAQAQADGAQLVAGLSHELQPLLARLLELQPGSAMPVEVAGRIADMERATAQFRDFARPLHEEVPQPLQLNPLLQELVAQRPSSGVVVAMQWGVVPPVHLRPSALRLVVANLLDNALRYGREVTVTISFEEGWVVVRVLDRGPGVASHELPLLGRPFYRTETGRGRSSGTGLGLAIVRQEVEQHGGVLRLANDTAGGFRAEVWLRPGGTA
jgi:two-component system osmolarity sensor histidine kinase EnvZ